MNQVKRVLDDLTKIGTIEWVFFEGGEPFLFYPLMLQGISLARDSGFKTGVVTNAYWAISTEDSMLWLKPLYELGVSDVTVGDDLFHYEDEKDSPAKKALTAAKRLGLQTGSICIEKPTVKTGIDKEQNKGAPVIGGGAMSRGRAAEKLVEGLPKRPWKEFKDCPYEDLRHPNRVHIDSYGNVHLCQGISMGNMWEHGLSQLVKNYNADSHPICGPLVRGGPASLTKEYNVTHEEKYVDACHLCYLTRLKLIDKFPQYLAPKQVYGLK